jgi:hypothetical protein
MQNINLPAFDYLIRESKQRKQIFDVFRKKYVVLTPEEWVRQHLAHYLVNELHYPKGLMHLEAALENNGMKKRADIVIYNKSLTPILLCECKQPAVKLSQAVFDQVSQYNIHFKVPYLLISNGLEHYCAKVNFEKNEISFLQEIPAFNML